MGLSLQRSFIFHGGKTLSPHWPTPALRTEPSSALLTEPTPALRTEPSSALLTEPSPALLTEPSSALLTEPTPALLTEPSSALLTEPSPAFRTERGRPADGVRLRVQQLVQGRAVRLIGYAQLEQGEQGAGLLR